MKLVYKNKRIKTKILILKTYIIPEFSYEKYSFKIYFLF